jgi:rod shape-determining protein MreD
MGKTVFWTAITVLFLSLIEAAILSNLMFLPVVPDLVLLVIVYVSFQNSSITGSTTGFIGGLFLDFLSASPIGLNAFTMTTTGFIFGKSSGSFNLNKIFIPAIMGCSATIMKAVLSWVLSLFFGSGILLYKFAGSTLWFEILANTLCAPLIFAFLGLFPSLFIQDKRHQA